MATPTDGSVSVAASTTPIYLGRTADSTAIGDVGNMRITIWGQSNAIGRADGADLSASPLSSDAELAQYWSGSLTFSRVYIWTGSAYATLTASNNGAAAGQFGPEFGLAVRWMRETTTGNLYINKEAGSGVSITYFDITNWIYAGMKTRQLAADSWLASHSVTLANTHWLWVQGESDYLQTQTWYAGQLTTLVNGRATDGLHPATGIQVYAKMKVGSATYGAAIDAAKDDVIAVNPTYRKWLRMDYYRADNIHCNGRGQVQLGYDAFEKIFNGSHISV